MQYLAFDRHSSFHKKSSACTHVARIDMVWSIGFAAYLCFSILSIQQLLIVFFCFILITFADSVTTDEANGLFSVKSELSLTLTRQELEGYFECRVETPALDNLVRNQLHIDLQGNKWSEESRPEWHRIVLLIRGGSLCAASKYIGTGILIVF